MLKVFIKFISPRLLFKVSYEAGSSGVPNVTRLEYKSLPADIQKLTLSFDRVGDIQGNWTLAFPVEMFKLHEWNPNIKAINQGTEININKVSFSGGQIKINCIKPYEKSVLSTQDF